MTEPQERYAEYLKSDYWKQVTALVKERADFRCQVCNSPHDLEAHHRSYAHRGSELQHISDMTCLCRRCHGIFHGKSGHVEPPTMPVVHVGSISLKKAKNGKRAGFIVPHGSIESEMPPGDPIVITRELIDLCRTNGSFTAATIRALGVPIPPKKGWGRRLIGKRMTRNEFRAVLEARYVYAKDWRNSQQPSGTND